jgi:cytochrome P450
MGDRATADFDHLSAEFLDNRHAEWARLRQCPVAFNPRHGGFWVVSGYDEVAQVSRDGETFSSKYEEDSPDGIEYLGIMGIPRVAGIPSAGIAEAEGPVHQALRRVLNPVMLPPAVEQLRPWMEQVATWFLDQKIGAGDLDLVLDFTNPVPAVLTMKLVGLPCDDWEHYAEVFHATVAYPAGAPEHRQAVRHIPDMMAGLIAEAGARRREPRDDLLTELVHLRVDGDRLLSDAEITGVLWNLIGGGLDTTTSLTALALHYLDDHHDQRQQLIDDPGLLVPATEEFLRFFSVNETLSRTVTRDVSLGGQQLHRGDFLILSWLSANHDETEFVDAERVTLARAPNRHLAFGVGPHRCIGMHLARTMFRVLMQEVLRRIPDYRIDRAATRFYQGNPELTGIVTMPARFTPGPVVGPAVRPF